MTVDPKVETRQLVYALRHMETGEYICLLDEGHDYLACFSDGDTAIEFRTELNLQEHVDIVTCRVGVAPFLYLWLDGEMVDLREAAAV
jgi:hypothetical protein